MIMNVLNQIKKIKPAELAPYIYAPILSFAILYFINLFYQNTLPSDMYIHQLPKNILYCALSSLTFFIYLKKSRHFQSISQLYMVVLAMAYGLSSYAVLSNSYSETMFFYALVPIIFLSLESIKDGHGYVMFSVFCAVSLCVNTLDSCILFIYLSIYFLVFSNTGFAKRIVDFLHLLLCYAFSFLLSLALCVPQLSVFFSDNRNSVYPGFAVNYQPATFLSRFLTGSAPSEYFTYGRGLDLYFGMFFFLLLILYFFNSSIEKKDRLKNFCFLLFLIGTLQLTPLMHLMELCQATQAFSIYYSVFFTFYCLHLASVSLNSLAGMSKKSMLCGVVVSIFMVCFALIGSSHNFMPITKEMTVCFFALYVLGLLIPYFSEHASTQKMVPYFVIMELAVNILIMINQSVLPASLDISDSYALFEQESTESDDTLEQSDTSSSETDKSIDDYNNFYDEHYASDMSDTLYFIGDHIEITESDKEQFDMTGDLNELEAFNLRGHILGVAEDVFTKEDISIAFDSSEKYKVIDEGNNLYCLEQTPDTLKDGQVVVPYHYENPENKHYIILCSFYDYMMEDLGDNDTFDGLLSFTASRNLSFRFQLSVYSINEDALSKVSAALFTDADPTTHEQNNYYAYIILLIISAIGVILLLHLTIDKGKAKTIKQLNLFKEHFTNAGFWTKMRQFLMDNRVYFMAFFIPFAVFVSAMIYYGSAPFGQGSFLDSDGISSSLAASLNYYYNLKAGNITLSTLGGYANGIFPGLYIIFYLPMLLFSADALPAVFMIFDAILLGFSGLFICYYFTHRFNGVRADKSDWKLLIPALIYSLNTFMIAMHSYIFWWYLLLALFPLLVLFEERLIYEKKWLPYSLLLFFCILTNFNIALYICIYLVIHFFTCKFDNFKDFIVKGFRFAIPSLLGALCNFSNLYGLFAGLFTQRAGTGYAESDSVAPSFGFFTSYFNQWKQFMLFTPCKTITANDGHINLYMGVFFLILFALFVTSQKIKLTQKLKYLIPTFILFISFNEEVTTYVWNGFHYQVSVPNRHAFLFAFVAAMVAFEVLYHMKEISIKQMGLCTGLSILFMCACQFLGDGNTKLAFGATLLVLALYFILYFVFNRISRIKKYLMPVMITVFVLEISVNVFYDCTSFALDNISIYTDYEKQADYHAKLLETDTQNAYRFSLPASYGANNGFIVKAPTGTYFNSFLSNYLQYMSYYYGLYYGHNFIMAHHNATPLTMALSSCKYIEVPCYSTASLGDLYNYNYFDTINGHFILENPDALSFGIYVPSEIEFLPEEVLDTPASFQNYIVHLVTNDEKDVYNGPITLKSDFSEESDFSGTNYIRFKTPDNTYVSQPKAREIIYGEENAADPVFTSHHLYCEITVTPKADGPLYLYANEFVYLGEGKAGKESTFTIPYPNKTCSEGYEFTCYTFDQEQYSRFIQDAKSNQLENVKLKDNVLTADIDYDEEGYTMFSLPYTTAWKIYIDGNEVEPEDLMNSYLFVKTPAGKHKLRMVYDNSGSIRGVWISIGIICGLCLLAFVEKKVKKPKKEKDYI